MYLRLLFISLSLAILSITTSNTIAAEKKAKERLAVLDLEAKHGVEKSFAEALSVIVRDKLHSYGDYQIMSLDDIQKVASREQLLQTMGCDDGTGQCLVSFGRAIGTRFMVAGDLSKLGTTYTVSLRMLDTKGDKAGVTNRVSEKCKCDTDALIETVEDVAAKLIGKPTTAESRKIEEERENLAEEARRSEERVILNGEAKNVTQRSQPIVETQEGKQNDRLNLPGTASFKSSESSSKTTATTPIRSFSDPITGMEFVNIPRGCFNMGSSKSDLQRLDNEGPVHEVCLDPFYMGKYEVTQEQYIRVTGNNPSSFREDNNLPVEEISWHNAQEYIKLLNEKSGKKYRLPSEAEWEYAARAGTTTPFYFGNNVTALQANLGGNTQRDGKFYKYTTRKVGSYPPNDFGLHDMHGNVMEWCSDWYDKSYYNYSPKQNPTGPKSGTDKVVRSGSGLAYQKDLRSSSRTGFDPNFKSNFHGFRLVFSD